MSSKQQIPFDPTWKPGFGSWVKNRVLGTNRNRLHARAPPPNNNTTTRRYRSNAKAKGRVRGTRRIRLQPLSKRITNINAESWKALGKPGQNDYYLNERTGKYKMYQDVIDEMEYGPYINSNNADPNIRMQPLREQAAHNKLPPTLSVGAYEELGYRSNPLQELYEPVYSQGYASGFGGATSAVILSYKLKGPNTSQRRNTKPPPTLSVGAYEELGYRSNPLQKLYEPVRSQDYASGYGGATSSVILSYKLKET